MTVHYLSANIWLFIKYLILNSMDTNFNASSTAFDNIVRKDDIVCNKQFLLFPQCFLLIHKVVSPFVNTCIYDISLFAAEFEEPKVGM